MLLQFPSLLDWPVLERELVRVGRKGWLHLFRYAFAAFLILQLFFLMPRSPSPNVRSASSPTPVFRPGVGLVAAEPPSILDIRRQELATWTAFWRRHTLLVLEELFWWIVLLTPAMTAGALGYEKEQGTLLALFGTQLRSSEIVLGKLFGRLIPVILPALAAMPILVLATISGESSFVGVFLALSLLLVLMVSVAAASMLTGVWTRRTSDAILACYALLVVVFIGSVVFLPDTPLLAWVDPGNLMEQIVSGSRRWLLVFLGQVFALGSMGGLCLALAIWRLRPACLRQQEQRAGRWLWAYRQAIGNDPIAWRERHVIGLAPAPWLHIVPTWMGLVGVFCFSAIIAGDAANYSTQKGLFLYLQQGNLVRAFESLQKAVPDRVHGNLIVMGLVLVLGGAVIVWVRCSNSIWEEKRRKTWEDLIMTPLTAAEIMAGKRRGILSAAVPALIAYALPMFGLAALGGSGGLVNAAFWVVIAIVAIVAAAFGGIASAERKRTFPWEAAAQIEQIIFSATVLPRSKEAPGYSEWMAAKRHKALPVYSDGAGLLLLRPDGQVLDVALDPAASAAEAILNGRTELIPFYGLAKPADSYRWLLAYVRAAKRYPELWALLPSRPHHADNCRECQGSGILHTLEISGRSLCPTCNGLGWVYVPPPEAKLATPGPVSA